MEIIIVLPLFKGLQIGLSTARKMRLIGLQIVGKPHLQNLNKGSKCRVDYDKKVKDVC